ncbi:DNA ligase I, putative [Trypanosoma brucei gambiense DAL972]|uniref:DNA ligase n=1 Tax=Trypanosoma brucei gambiense (strain MHOM/CI/86/DAL972) TaxID=679716 RepID=C9ZRF3_TRYB9|nr:DNA ligase I, putative [Trypanosoma brucei gambiense DAL972]CBH11983.1 DNA ligase I, putative [Trypanosoma brucei gambiense DAL972]|eukprot:XP_011774268.1 DNA ligase I, putative [Trypanosoma brucei gambiense DAL972]
MMIMSRATESILLSYFFFFKLFSTSLCLLFSINAGVVPPLPQCRHLTMVSGPTATAVVQHKRIREDEDDIFDGERDDEMSAGCVNMAKIFLRTPPDPYGGCHASVWPRPQENQKQGPDTVPYAAVADTLADISAESSRLECIRLLSNFLVAVIQRNPIDLVPVVYLVINKQGPAHEGIELGVGDALLLKVVAECCGITEARAKEEYRQTGDLAEVAQSKKRIQSTLVKPKRLTALAVFQALREIALMSGKDVARRRGDVIKRLLRDAVGPEVNLIVRALQQKMRVGLAETSVLAAVGYAFAMSNIGVAKIPSLTPEQLQRELNVGAANLTRTYNEVPCLDVVLAAVLQHGLEVIVPTSAEANMHARALSVRPGIPVKPQLAHPTSGVSVILDRFNGKAFTSEYKYDGERAQIHYTRGSGVQIFSRNSETNTSKYPDIISMLPEAFSVDTVDSFIIDAEVVAVDKVTGALQAFQVLQHRGRKNVSFDNVKVPVCVFAFDILYFNGEPQMSKTLSQRREVLHTHFKPVSTKFRFAEYLDSNDVDDIQAFLDRAIRDGTEGLMVKTLEEESTYVPAKRSHYWLKLKKDYMDGVTDTLDLVPIGAYYGKGKRTGVFGGFLLACYDGEGDEYQSICKIGTGFQDDQLEAITKSLQPSILDEQPRYYRTEDKPDVWFQASQVWEVKAADLSISPAHFAAYGLVDASKGIALRFPRFIRVREDKKVHEATSAAQVAEMYHNQSLAQRGVGDME